jgi:hypothetical protein
MAVPGPGASKQAPLAEQPSAVLNPHILPAPQSASVVQLPLPPLLLPAPLLLLVVPPLLPPLLLVLLPPPLLPRLPSGVSMVVMAPEQPAIIPVAQTARTAPIRACK